MTTSTNLFFKKSVPENNHDHQENVNLCVLAQLRNTKKHHNAMLPSLYFILLQLVAKK